MNAVESLWSDSPQPPLKPFTPRSSSSRPTTQHRYLQEATGKLAEDALHGSAAAAAVLQAPPPCLAGLQRASPQPPGSRASGGTDLQSLACSADMWRRAFHAEAMDCVRAMQAVVDRADLSHFNTRFDEWRKTDLKVTAQVQHHVKELARLNQSLDHFLSDCSSLDNLADFKSSFLALKECVEELSTTRKELSSSVDVIARQSAAKVLVAWKGEVQNQAEVQKEQWHAEQARWGRLEARMDGLQKSMQELKDVVQGNTERMESLENSQRNSFEQFSSLLEQSVKDMRETSENAADQIAEGFNQISATNFEAFKGHVTEVLSGEGGISASLETLDSRMTGWESTANSELAQHRESAEQLQGQVSRLEQAAEAARGKQASAEDACRETTETFSAKLRALQDDLNRSQRSLEKALDSSLSSGMRKLKDLDMRGNVKLNRQTGAVKLANPIDFTPCKPPQKPCPEFQDPITADKVIVDIVELMTIFDQPLSVEVLLKPGKGGNPAFWEEAAQAQAELVRSRLEGCGAKADRLSATGLASGKGVPGVNLKLDDALFPEQEDPKDAKKSASPARKGK